MKYLLDTCLISELVKKEPNPAVVDWLDAQDEQTLFLSVLNLGELQKEISKLTDGVKKDELQAWVSHDLVERFSGCAITGISDKKPGKVTTVDEVEVQHVKAG